VVICFSFSIPPRSRSAPPRPVYSGPKIIPVVITTASNTISESETNILAAANSPSPRSPELRWTNGRLIEAIYFTTGDIRDRVVTFYFYPYHSHVFPNSTMTCREDQDEVETIRGAACPAAHHSRVCDVKDNFRNDERAASCQDRESNNRAQLSKHRSKIIRVYSRISENGFISYTFNSQLHKIN
jgi:hypothetical protein